MNLHIDAYKNKHVCQRGYLVGKGPSLDTIEQSAAPFEMEGGVVFCLNEAIHKIEALGMDLTFDTPLYCVQQDSELEARCTPHHETTTHFMNDWQSTPDTKGVKIRVSISQWNPRAVLYRYPEWELSAVVALDIMTLMGIQDVTLVCFDALENNYSGPEMYAKCITTPPSIHKGPSNIGPHRGSGRQIVSKAKEVMRSLKTIHPHVPEVEFSK